MKLVDILARELKVWPEGADEHCTQSNETNEVYFGIGADSFWPTEHADDAVTRAQWQSAVDALKAEKVVEWNGEGLPPVGAACEIKLGPQWTKVEVLAYFVGQPVVGWICAEGECVQMMHVSELRPIRTPEQIAKQERSKACDKMYGVILDRIPQDRRNNGSDICEALYDAGYRKFEIVDN